MSYGQIISEFRHYDITEKPGVAITPTKAILKLLTEQQADLNSPPSYSAVLAEKYKQEQWMSNYDKTLDEMNNLILFMRKTMKDTEILLTSYQHCCQRLECKNQYLLDLIEKERSTSSTTQFEHILDQSEHLDMNDSLNRMNEALGKLIHEAQTSLDTRYLQLPLKKSQSCPTFNLQENQLLQKKRYLHSQWKLTIAMKQFIETVHKNNKYTTQQPERATPVANTTIHHHHHHHYYHKKPSFIPEEVEEEEKLVEEGKQIHEEKVVIVDEPLTKRKHLSKAISLSSLFKYAVDTVTDLIPQQAKEPVKVIESKTIKHRMMFLCTIVISQKFNFKRNSWITRSRTLLNRWKQRQDLYNMWMHKSKLFFYVIQFVNT